MPHYHNKKETKKIGKRIQDLRKGKSLSIEDVAEMTGFTRGLINAVEDGKNTDTSHLVEIAKAIGVHPMEIFNVPFDIKPRFKLSPKRQQRDFLTQKIRYLFSNTDFFNSQRFVADVMQKLTEDFEINPNSTIVSVVLKRLVNENKLSAQKSGRRNSYFKKRK